MSDKWETIPKIGYSELWGNGMIKYLGDLCLPLELIEQIVHEHNTRQTLIEALEIIAGETELIIHSITFLQNTAKNALKLAKGEK